MADLVTQLGTQQGEQPGEGAGAPGSVAPGGERVSRTVQENDPPQEAAWLTAFDKDKEAIVELRDFVRQKADDPLAWEYDHAKMAKTLNDRLAHGTRLAERLAELDKGDGEDPVGKALEDYTKTMDVEALKKRAPKAYRGRDADGKHLGEQAFFKGAIAAGIGTKRARQAFAVMMEELNGHIPDAASYEEREAAAMKAIGPNGPAMLADFQAQVKAAHRKGEFSEAQLTKFDAISLDPDMLPALWRIARGDAMDPPEHEAPVQSMSAADYAEAVVSDRYANDAAYAAMVDAGRQAALKREGRGGGSGERISRVVA